MTTLILTGDLNLMNVADPAVPFAQLRDLFRSADAVFCNLECCLYQPPRAHSFHNEGFFADPAVGGEALQLAGIAAVGVANNVNYGDEAILASLARLDELGIPHRRRHRSGRGPRAGIAGTRRVAVRVPAAQRGVLADQPRSRSA